MRGLEYGLRRAQRDAPAARRLDDDAGRTRRRARRRGRALRRRTSTARSGTGSPARRGRGACARSRRPRRCSTYSGPRPSVCSSSMFSGRAAPSSAPRRRSSSSSASCSGPAGPRRPGGPRAPRSRTAAALRRPDAGEHQQLRRLVGARARGSPRARRGPPRPLPRDRSRRRRTVAVEQDPQRVRVGDDGQVLALHAGCR